MVNWVFFVWKKYVCINSGYCLHYLTLFPKPTSVYETNKHSQISKLSVYLCNCTLQCYVERLSPTHICWLGRHTTTKGYRQISVHSPIWLSKNGSLPWFHHLQFLEVFPMNHNVCLSVGLGLAVCRKSVRKNNFITKCNVYIFHHATYKEASLKGVSS